MKESLSEAFKATIPVAMGYMPLAVTFGFIFQKAGADWFLAPVMSIVLYAGAAQFMSVPMLGQGLPIWEIALAVALVNLRHVFYGLSLHSNLPRSRLGKVYFIHALTDETYSLLTAREGGTSGRFKVMVAAINQAWWVAGSTLGALLGLSVSQDVTGLDFALTALFVVLCLEQGRAVRSNLPFLAGLAGAALAWLLLPGQFLVGAIGIAAVILLTLGRRA
ncbi:AzlC family ABC transporter permease [Telmatospirillum sp. J64-1]|uniref:AzlC family ABC transporter permease n=1 Tax=Telmatospirillum sp. J64-1 TaxID=2502183 RepID=UPI00115E40E4|nr:AzlC family ABC transporter permease [Telmatospirillum sp. J64-1]